MTIDIDAPGLIYIGKKAFYNSAGTVKIARITGPDLFSDEDREDPGSSIFLFPGAFDGFDGEIVIELPDCLSDSVSPILKPFCRHICEAHTKRWEVDVSSPLEELVPTAELCCARYVELRARWG